MVRRVSGPLPEARRHPRTCIHSSRARATPRSVRRALEVCVAGPAYPLFCAAINSLLARMVSNVRKPNGAGARACRGVQNSECSRSNTARSGFRDRSRSRSVAFAMPEFLGVRLASGGPTGALGIGVLTLGRRSDNCRANPDALETTARWAAGSRGRAMSRLVRGGLRTRPSEKLCWSMDRVGGHPVPDGVLARTITVR